MNISSRYDSTGGTVHLIMELSSVSALDNDDDLNSNDNASTSFNASDIYNENSIGEHMSPWAIPLVLGIVLYSRSSQYIDSSFVSIWIKYCTAFFVNPHCISLRIISALFTILYADDISSCTILTDSLLILQISTAPCNVYIILSIPSEFPIPYWNGYKCSFNWYSYLYNITLLNIFLNVHGIDIGLIFPGFPGLGIPIIFTANSIFG